MQNKKIIIPLTLIIMIIAGYVLWPKALEILPKLTLDLPIETIEPVITKDTAKAAETEPEILIQQPEAVPQNVPEKPIIKEVKAPFIDLLNQNQDVVAWIKIPNTKVDYPVAQSNDNDYYLHRDLNHKTYEPGTLFMDFRNAANTEDRHAVIYGHNMKNDSMFGSLDKFKKVAFYDENRFFTIITPYEDTQWEIFAAYVSPPTLDLIQTDFKDDRDFLEFIDERSSKSKYPLDVEIEPDDNILTLITCSYEFPDARFVIHARKLKE